MPPPATTHPLITTCHHPPQSHSNPRTSHLPQSPTHPPLAHHSLTHPPPHTITTNRYLQPQPQYTYIDGGYSSDHSKATGERRHTTSEYMAPPRSAGLSGSPGSARVYQPPVQVASFSGRVSSSSSAAASAAAQGQPQSPSYSSSYTPASQFANMHIGRFVRARTRVLVCPCYALRKQAHGRMCARP